MTTLTLGEVTVSRVIEIDRSSFLTTQMLPDSTVEAIARHRDWLKPFWDDRACSRRPSAAADTER